MPQRVNRHGRPVSHFPITDSRPLIAREFSANVAKHPHSFVVAVVDDDQSVLRSLECLLESADYAVRLFTSAAALLESGCLPDIDCLISDVDMPHMDAIDLLARIHTLRPGLRTILITGYPEKLNQAPPLDGVYPGLFIKPFQSQELLDAVRDVLRNSRD